MIEASVNIKFKDEYTALRLILPTKWDELTTSQLLFIAKYWASWQQLAKIGDTLIKAKWLLFLELTGFSAFNKTRLSNAITAMSPDAHVDFLVFTDFIFEELNLTKNLLPKVKVGMFNWYHGPSDRLKDVSGEEFSFAFAFYSHYNKTGNETYLNSLMAVLYRPRSSRRERKLTGDHRCEFNKKKSTIYLEKVRQLPDEYKHAVYLYFRGCLEYLSNRYKVIFRRAKQDQDSGGNFMETILAISGAKLGPIQEAQRLDIYLLLQELTNLMIAAEESKKK